MDETRIYSVDSETFDKLSHANDELTSDYQKRINEVVAETKRLEKQSRKQ